MTCWFNLAYILMLFLNIIYSEEIMEIIRINIFPNMISRNVINQMHLQYFNLFKFRSLISK